MPEPFSKWHRAMGIHSGDTLVQYCDERDGRLITTGYNVIRNGVEIPLQPLSASE